MSRFFDTSTETQMAQIMVQYGRPSRSSRTDSVRPSSGRNIMGQAIRENPMEVRLGRRSRLGMFLCSREKDYSCLCMWTVFNWLGRNKSLTQCGKNLWKKSIRESQHHSLTMFIWVALNKHAKRAKKMWKITETCLNPESLLVLSKKQLCSGKLVANISSWSFDTESHAKKCAEIHCELANKTTQQLYKIATPCFDDRKKLWTEKNKSTPQLHEFTTSCLDDKKEEMRSVGELSKVCPQIGLKCLYLARIGRPDILCSVNKLARSITKWTKACDKRLSRLIFHHTCEYTQYGHVGKHQHNNAGWDCFRTLALLEIL